MAVTAAAPGAGWQHRVLLRGEAETARLGALLAPLLHAGDVLLLQGDLGAGKSALARALIRARLGDPAAEVPSPSYTLVNIYEPGRDAPAIWHADLYRLAGIDDLVELGLEDAFDRAICLIEWPGRLGPLAPRRALTITLQSAEQDRAREARVSASGCDWSAIRSAIAGAGGAGA